MSRSGRAGIGSFDRNLETGPSAQGLEKDQPCKLPSYFLRTAAFSWGIFFVVFVDRVQQYRIFSIKYPHERGIRAGRTCWPLLSFKQALDSIPNKMPVQAGCPCRWYLETPEPTQTPHAVLTFRRQTTTLLVSTSQCPRGYSCSQGLRHVCVWITLPQAALAC